MTQKITLRPILTLFSVNGKYEKFEIRYFFEVHDLVSQVLIVSFILSAGVLT